MKTLLYILLLMSLIACQDKQIVQSPKPGPEPEDNQEMIPLEELLHPAEALVPNPNRNCGEEEIDPETGRMTRVPNADLVLSHVEVVRTDLGTWIRPTVRNDCDQPVHALFGVLIQSDHPGASSVVTMMSNIPAHGEVQLGHGIGVPEGSSYTLTVDWDNRIPEAHEGNNRCRVTETGPCR